MLKKLKDKDGGKLCCSINTFGFGYELDSDLLSKLAIDGLGTYAFIPDAGYVGTVFVNSMSNLLSTMARDVTVKLEALNGATFVGTGVVGGHPHSAQSATSISVMLGSIQYGQSRDLVVRMLVPPGAVDAGYLRTSLDFVTAAGPISTPGALGSGKSNPAEFPVVEQQSLRLQFVDCVREIMKVVTLSAIDRAQGKKLPLADAQAMVQTLADLVGNSKVADEEQMMALLEDVQGQVCEAVSREEWYTKWGIHYLPSLMFAHLSQQCNNFKDAGVQGYGGDLFGEIRDKADEIFLALPPPKPSVRRPAPSAAPTQAYSSFGAGSGSMLGFGSSARPPSPVNMSAFYDRCAG